MITPGAILIENGTLLPEPLTLESDSTATGWASVANHLDGRQLQTALTTAGWHFFYMAGAIKKSAFGFQKQQTIDAALKSVLAAAKLQSCNCLQIDGIALRSFLGIPYASVSAHSRHIQRGMVLSAE